MAAKLVKRFHISAVDWALVVKRAEAEDRSPSSLVRRAITAYVKRDAVSAAFPDRDEPASKAEKIREITCVPLDKFGREVTPREPEPF